MQAQSILHAQAALGEGALWNSETTGLYRVGIEGRALHVCDPATGRDRCYLVGKRIGTVVLRRDGCALVALQTGTHAIDLTTGRLTRLADPVTDQYLRFNDGKCDPAGRFWVGTFDMMQRRHPLPLRP